MGLAIGGILGLVGAGGAVIAVPAFLYLFGFSALEATTASLAVVAASASAGAIPRIRRQQVWIRPALAFWALGILGTLLGSRVAPLLPEWVIVGGFATVMVAAGVAMWRRSSASERRDAERRGRWLLPVVALSVGFLTGVFGVGGGFLIVPALVLVFDIPFAFAAGTSLVVVALNSLTALAFKWDAVPDVDWQVPVLVIVGGLVGAVVASQFSGRVPRRILERGFAVLLLVLAGWMVAEVALLGG